MEKLILTPTQKKLLNKYQWKTNREPFWIEVTQENDLFGTISEHINTPETEEEIKIQILIVGYNTEGENKEASGYYPFKEGEDYWTIEGNEKKALIKSCWDDQSEEFHDEDPNKKYFSTLEEGIEFIRETINPVELLIYDYTKPFYTLKFI